MRRMDSRSGSSCGPAVNMITALPSRARVRREAQDVHGTLKWRNTRRSEKEEEEVEEEREREKVRNKTKAGTKAGGDGVRGRVTGKDRI